MLSNVKRLIDEANEVLSGGDPEKALHLYDDVLNSLDDCVIQEQVIRTIWANRALALDALCRHKEAVSAMDEAIKYLKTADDKTYSAMHVLRNELIDVAKKSVKNLPPPIPSPSNAGLNKKPPRKKSNSKNNFFLSKKAAGVALLAGYNDVRNQMENKSKNDGKFHHVYGANGRVDATTREQQMLDYINRLDQQADRSTEAEVNRLFSKDDNLANESKNEAIRLKTAGNDALRAGERCVACMHYTQGTYAATVAMACTTSKATIDETSEILKLLWSNRSAVLLDLGVPHVALADAYECLDCRGAASWPKTYLRLGKCSLALGGVSDAIDWFNHGAKCAELQGLEREREKLMKASKNACGSIPKGSKSENEKAALELGLESPLFYKPNSLLPFQLAAYSEDEKEERKGWKKRIITISEENQKYFTQLCSVSSNENIKKICTLIEKNSNQYETFETERSKHCDAMKNGGNGVEIRHTSNVGGGRGLFARRNFKENDIIFAETPIVSVSRDSKRCHLVRCLPSLSKSQSTVLPDGSFASIELEKLRRKVLFSENEKVLPLSLCYHSIAIARILIMMYAEAAATTVVSTMKMETTENEYNINYKKLLPELRLPKSMQFLLGTSDINCKKMNFTQEIIMPFTQRYNEFTELKRAFGIDVTKEDGKKIRDPRFDFAIYDLLWGQLLLNCLWTGTGTVLENDNRADEKEDDNTINSRHESDSISLTALGSFINHHKEPNVKIKVYLLPQKNGEFYKEVIVFRAAKPIKTGEELTICYSQADISDEERKNFLQRNYFFVDEQ
eukprot:g6316.t1